MTSTTSAPSSPQEAVEVRTENLFQRTEVLAGMCQHSSLLFPEAEQQPFSSTLLQVEYSAGMFPHVVSVANI